MPKGTDQPLFLVATDGSPPSEAALDYAISLAKRLGARLRIVSVSDIALLQVQALGGAQVAVGAGGVEAATTEIVTAAERKARDAGLAAEGVAVDFSDPSTAILRQAEANPVSLVIVGSHSRKGVRRLLLGSVAERVVRLAPCPVLVVR
jgi:nucleotide-binding universal stress UspA family protein